MVVQLNGNIRYQQDFCLEGSFDSGCVQKPGGGIYRARVTVIVNETAQGGPRIDDAYYRGDPEAIYYTCPKCS